MSELAIVAGATLIGWAVHPDASGAMAGLGVGSVLVGLAHLLRASTDSDKP